MRISDWSSDVCSSDLADPFTLAVPAGHAQPFADEPGPGGLPVAARAGERALDGRQGCHGFAGVGGTDGAGSTGDASLVVGVVAGSPVGRAGVDGTRGAQSVASAKRLIDAVGTEVRMGRPWRGGRGCQ